MERQRKTTGKWLRLAAGIMTALAGLLFGIIGHETDKARPSDRLQSDIFDTFTEQHIASLSNIPKEDALNIEIKKLSSSLADLNSREMKIESVTLGSPSKALEMPLLKLMLNVEESVVLCHCGINNIIVAD